MAYEPMNFINGETPLDEDTMNNLVVGIEEAIAGSNAAQNNIDDLTMKILTNNCTVVLNADGKIINVFSKDMINMNDITNAVTVIFGKNVTTFNGTLANTDTLKYVYVYTDELKTWLESLTSGADISIEVIKSYDYITLLLKSTGVISDEQIALAVESYLEENPIEGVGEPGEDGVSPTVEVAEDTDTSYRLSITDANGTTITPNLKGADGTNGTDGSNGEDGTSVTVASVSESTEDDGSNVVTFSDGKTVTIKNGSKGSTGEKGDTGEQGPQGVQGIQGEKGEKGDTGATGPAGADGYTPVKGTDYFTEDDKAEMVEQVTALVNSDVIPDYWTEHLDGKIAEIKKLQKSGGRNCFSFVVMTDMHYESNLAKLAPTLAKKIMDECGIKFCLCLGDTATRHGANHDEAYADNEWANIEAMLAPIRDRLLITQGNHDGSYDIIDLNSDGVADDINADGTVDSYDKNVYNWTPQKLYENIFRKVSTIDNVNFSSDGTGYYVDDKGSKVRYILLNTHVNKWEQNEDGSMKYNNMYNFRFGQSQYDMVVEALQSVPTDDWSVVIGCHVPLDRTQEYTYWGGEENESGSLAEGSVADCTVMQKLLNAYHDKTSYSGIFYGTASGGLPYTNYADTTSADWWADSRLDSSGNQSTSSGYDVTNYIPITTGDKVYLKNATIYVSNRVAAYDANKERIYLGAGSGMSSYITTADGITTLDTNFLKQLTTSYADVAYIRFGVSIDDSIEPIITVNEEIVETENNGYDYVSVNADFTSAKGNLTALFSGHAHADNTWMPSLIYNDWEESCFPIVTTRSDGRVENTTELMEERVAGTITEQSFDVFTINTSERRIYATKIGAGSDRGKETAITY